MTDRPLHLAVALDSTGWHPAAWRLPSARPRDLFRPSYWIDLARTADAAGVELLTLDDTLVAPPAGSAGDEEHGTDRVHGRLDALLIASLVAPLTTRIGLVPVVTTTHTEPFHVASAVATLDWTSRGRAGWQVRIGAGGREAALFGRRRPEDLTPAARFAEAADVVAVVRDLWDSWEDDAVIKDAATGRFIDRDRLHAVDFQGEWFSVKGPAIVPRPPQGRPVVAMLAHAARAWELAAGSADVVFVTPRDIDDIAAVVSGVRTAEATVGRTGEPLRILADLIVHLDDDATRARTRRSWLDDRAGDVPPPDAAVFAGSPAELAEYLAAGHERGVDGFRLRPAALPVDLAGVAAGLVPALRARGLRPAHPPRPGETLRTRLGLPRPPSRYAAA